MTARCTIAFVLIVGLGVPALARAEEAKDAGKAGASKAPASTKADKAKADPPDDGKLLSEEELRLGPFKKPPVPYPFPVLGDERATELYVDREGKIYADRKYSGHVPRWQGLTSGPKSRNKRCEVLSQPVEWVGFQNGEDVSRVFVMTAKDACGYVYSPDDAGNVVVIDLPKTYLANSTLRHDILTGAFPTAVNQVHVEEIAGHGTRIVIALKRKVPYLSARVGRYVFIDFPR